MPSSTSFESLREEPTVVEGQRRRDARVGLHGALDHCGAAGQTDCRPSLHARCVTCGATASDWRHLLGVGASAVACSADSRSMLLTYPGACGRCGASTLLVDILLAARMPRSEG
jgi:hypothetical protein